MTGYGGGPMPLAKLAARWPHVAGKRHALASSVDRSSLSSWDLQTHSISVINPRAVESARAL
jgi:hypothetical protein